MTDRPQRNPLLFYVFVASLIMSALSVATWVGRPSYNGGAKFHASEDLRSMASVEATEQPTHPEISRWEVVELTVPCSNIPSEIAVASHQHQIQFQFLNCPELSEPDALRLIDGDQGDLIMFPSERTQLLDSEIVQLKEGANEFTLQWKSADQERSFNFIVNRAPLG